MQSTEQGTFMGSIANSLRRQLPTAFAAVAVVFLIALAIWEYNPETLHQPSSATSVSEPRARE